jgi:hypothetical protein
MVGIVASRRQRAHCCTCVSAQVPGQMCRPIVGRKMVGGTLIGALSISLVVTGATVTLAQNSAMSPSEPAVNAGVAKGVPLPPSPPGLRDVSVTIPLPSPELLERQSEPDCEIPPSDRLLGAIPETTRLTYERQCYKNAETVVRSKLQLLQDTIAGTIKALNDAVASRTLQRAEGGEQGVPAPAKDAAIAPKAGASAAKSSEAPVNAGDRRDAKSDPSGDQGVESPDQRRKSTPSARLSVNLSSREGDVPKSSSPDAAVSEWAHHEKTRGTQTANMSAQSKPVRASVKAVACQTSKPAGHGTWAWRLIDGRKCWYEGAVGMEKSILHWPPLKDVPHL